MADVFDQINSQAQQQPQPAKNGDVFDQIHANGATPATPGADETAAPSFGGFLKNTLHSAGNFAADLAGPILNPVRTLDGVTGLLEGISEKTGMPPVAGQSHAQYVDSLAKFYSDRYGGFDKFRKTLYNDPIGVLSDIASIAGVGGAAARGVEMAGNAAKLGTVANAAGKVADVAGAVSHATNPLDIAGKVADVTGVTKLADKAADAASTALTRSALRRGHTENTPAAEVAGAVNASKDLGVVPFSQAGIDKVNNALADIRKEITAKTGAAGQAGITIDPQKVQLRLDDIRRKYGLQVNPDADLKSIDKVADTFSRNNPGPIPVDQAQNIKVGSNSVLSGKYGKASQAQIEAEKALTRGLKEELENAIPELGKLNADQAKLMDLEGVLSKAVNKYVVNGAFTGSLLKNTIGSKEGAIRLGAITGTGALLHDPAAGAAVGVMQAVLSDPAVKTRLAQGIEWGRQANPSPKIPSGLNGFSRVNEYVKSLNGAQQ